VARRLVPRSDLREAEGDERERPRRELLVIPVRCDAAAFFAVVAPSGRPPLFLPQSLNTWLVGEANDFAILAAILLYSSHTFRSATRDSELAPHHLIHLNLCQTCRNSAASLSSLLVFELRIVDGSRVVFCLLHVHLQCVELFCSIFLQ
jgi:hypothetical protein